MYAIRSYYDKAKPDEVKFMMVDPKMVELNVYNGIPHLLTPVVTDPRRASLVITSYSIHYTKLYDSIPDSVGVCLETPEGNVVHTGDFKFDHTPVNNQFADLHRMGEIGKNGVLARNNFV